MELELNEQHGRSPRASQDLSGKELGLLNHEDGDSYAADGNIHDPNNAPRSAGVNGSAGGDDDLDGDESDDDLMDKISSSPSIGDDGGCPLSLPPNNPPPRPMSPQGTPSDVLSSSPYNETPPHFPILCLRKGQDHISSQDHHHEGEYVRNKDTHFRVTNNGMGEERGDCFFETEPEDLDDSFEDSLISNDFQHLLVPTNDPLLDDGSTYSEESSSDDSQGHGQSSHVEAQSIGDDDDTDDDDDDDTEDVSLVEDARFIDSGWGGECLQDTEDIDFEFVYALHTFVATVEGQANATKGDNMMLLDDSNSYWWLVRVIKDSSIGGCFESSELMYSNSERIFACRAY